MSIKIESWLIDPDSIEIGEKFNAFYAYGVGHNPQNPLLYARCYWFPKEHIWGPELCLGSDSTPFRRTKEDLNLPTTPGASIFSHVDLALAAVYSHK